MKLKLYPVNLRYLKLIPESTALFCIKFSFDSLPFCFHSTLHILTNVPFGNQLIPKPDLKRAKLYLKNVFGAPGLVRFHLVLFVGGSELSKLVSLHFPFDFILLHLLN